MRLSRLRSENEILRRLFLTLPNEMKKDVIIIGAGPGGLASAILLAAAGVKVKILERLPTIGGRTSSIEADGWKRIPPLNGPRASLC